MPSWKKPCMSKSSRSRVWPNNSTCMPNAQNAWNPAFLQQMDVGQLAHFARNARDGLSGERMAHVDHTGSLNYVPHTTLLPEQLPERHIDSERRQRSVTTELRIMIIFVKTKGVHVGSTWCMKIRLRERLHQNSFSHPIAKAFAVCLIAWVAR